MAITSSQHSMVVRFGQPRWPWVIVLLVSASLLVWVWWSRQTMAGWAVVVCSALGLLVFLPGLFFAETHLSADGALRLWRLLGTVPVWRRFYPVAGFRRVALEYHRGSEDSDCWVGFTMDTGGFFAVQCFPIASVEADCPDAHSLARQLSELTALPFSDHDHAS